MSIEKNIFCNTEQPTTVQIVTTGVFFHRINFMWCFRSNLHNSNLANGVTNISMTILSVISGNNSQGQRTTVNIPGYLHSARHVAYITATALNRLFLLSEYNTESLQWWTKLCLKKMSQVWLAIGLTYIHQFFYNFWHMSSAEIQKSAAGITFSNTSRFYLLYNALKWNDKNDAFSKSLL